MRTLICGCGYIGTALGAELARQGHEVFGIIPAPVNGDTLKNANITPLIANITSPAQLKSLPLPIDWVINTIASNRGNTDVFRAVYLQGTKNLIDIFSKTGVKKFIYTSSTSVYGQTDGSIVTETSPTTPASPASKILVETEKILLDAAQTQKFPAVILRVGGIYGTGRAFYLSQHLKGKAKITGDPNRYLNMIHQADVVGAIIAALRYGEPGQIYNVVDNEPVPQIRLFQWMADVFHLPLPASVPTRNSKRYLTNKQVSNHKLKTDLNCVLKYPTFREGYGSISLMVLG